MEALLSFLGGPVISFLGGSVFRMIWGELSSAWTKHQDHKQELARMEIQGRLEAEQHARNLQSIELQHRLGIEVIRVQGEVDISKIRAETDKVETESWYAAVIQAMKPTGIWLIDAWNGAIRPAAASLAMFLWFRALQMQSFVMQDPDRDLMCAILGFFFADRTLSKRGK